jgi:hypothetical protein
MEVRQNVAGASQFIVRPLTKISPDCGSKSPASSVTPGNSPESAVASRSELLRGTLLIIDLGGLGLEGSMKRFAVAMAYVAFAILEHEHHRLKGFLAISRSVLEEENARDDRVFSN